MSRPISAGDLCLIVRGLTQNKSPNIGKFVIVRHRVYGEYGLDHSQHGPVVRVEGPEVYQMNDSGVFVNLRWADVPVAWLKRIDPPEDRTTDTIDREVDEEETA